MSIRSFSFEKSEEECRGSVQLLVRIHLVLTLPAVEYDLSKLVYFKYCFVFCNGVQDGLNQSPLKSLHVFDLLGSDAVKPPKVRVS